MENPPMLDLVLKHCRAMTDDDVHLKSFLQVFLTHRHSELAFRRRFWFTNTGWASTRALLETIAAGAQETSVGRDGWRDFILQEAVKIAAKENVPQTYEGLAAYHNSRKIFPSMFDEAARTQRDCMLQENMGFFYNLLVGKLRASGTYGGDGDGCQDEDHRGDSDDGLEGEITLQGLKYRRSRDPQVNREYRIKIVATEICGMIAYTCNRRVNGTQMANGLTFLACGVTERVNAFLQFVGLSVARSTATSALRTLAKRNIDMIKSKLNDCPHKLAPFICIDNIDFEERVHHKRVERSSRMFHGSWGYFHILPDSVFDGIPPEDLSLKSYHDAMLAFQKTKIKPHDFYPTIEEASHWNSVVKAQLARVFFKYLFPDSKWKKEFKLSPAQVEPLPVMEPDVMMMTLMDAPDNSSEGVGDLLAKIWSQAGYGEEHAEKKLQVLEGDVGTCLNVDSLRNLRYPSGSATGSLDNLLLIPGAAHTLWNVGQAILLHHWGNTTTTQNMGVWRMVQSLGGKSEAPASKKDFSSMITMILKVHEADLVECIMQYLGLENLDQLKDKEPSKEVINRTLDACVEQFCSRGALDKAIDSGDQVHANFLLRLRDFATIMEANEAMKHGDIGRLIYMWHRWAIMAQGINGLTHYAIQLPRLLLLLEHHLPKGLAKVIKFALLIPPSKRHKHFIPKDQFLEHQNYWVKYFYNCAGSGTSIDRLIGTFSNNILLLQKLMHQLKERSGKNDIYQSHSADITLPTLKNALRMSRLHKLAELDPNRGGVSENPMVKDIYRTGLEKFKTMYSEGKLDKSKWGVYVRSRVIINEGGASEDEGSDVSSDSLMEM